MNRLHWFDRLLLYEISSLLSNNFGSCYVGWPVIVMKRAVICWQY